MIERTLTHKSSTLDEKAFRAIRSMIPGRRELVRDLQFMAKYKFNSYEVYSPGKRFLPSLLQWLNQFQSQSEKEAGLILVNKLLFLSRREILELCRVTYQNILHEIMNEIIKVEKLPPFAYPSAYRRLKHFLKRCVFVGMSDGAQIDYLRRHSNEMIENEQVVTYYKVDNDEKRQHSRAKYAFLVDDMCGSGTTFLRRERTKTIHRIDGQLVRFVKKWGRFAKFKAIYYCPYIITERGRRRLERLVNGPRRIVNRRRKFNFKIIYGMSIPTTYSILNSKNPLFPDTQGKRDRLRVLRLCEKYYDPNVEDEHTRKGGGCKFGFGQSGILLVRYNNTPNNTPSIVWHCGSDDRPTALFKRLARHHE